MSNLPFLVIENDLDVRLIRILIIISKLSYSSRKNPILTLQKISIYDFLLKYPMLLYYMSRDHLKNKFTLEDYEYNTIESTYIDKHNLYNYDDLHVLLQILIGYEFISIIRSKNELLYIITNKGTSFLESIDDKYIDRLIDLTMILNDTKSLKYKQILDLINIYLEGENEYE